ncbi:enoyl-CoA hydratase/isomerase family protein [Streptomyces sp. SL13]|uniref:3-hydroxyisobutyryl-CoA hydrolase n=1 Tax=Streptantibioticus silvisoli TaxID=2705255 RepID=A0AA90H6K9_9ACTN|nr:enoyl-CoA hydratase/isomerase family protein [Streptantibioticus silvisoli]MDI5974514.1 enoyl-CoA hydratase/isomerase family protein [Streptantibioticus silvisoli]
MPRPVQISVSDGVGQLVLDRPEALNALDLEMIARMSGALDAWRDDDAVRAVLVTSSSPKAFCAGGDIRAVRRAALDLDPDTVRRYFVAEYALDAAVADFPKPYVSLIDGYALGGGLGISVHGRYRVVTERAALAMPETGIGFFPDVGAGHFLSGLPGATGMYLGLTGTRVSGAAAVECGLATHYVESADLPALTADLLRDGGRATGEVLTRYAVTPPASELHGLRPAIDRCFGGPSLDGVLERLGAEGGEGGEWAAETLAVLERMSPSCLVLTFELLRRGARSTLRECFARDLLLAERLATTPDFAEGVRAALVDKDRTPRWSPATLADLDPAYRGRLLSMLD